jgi:riboflavin synthase
MFTGLVEELGEIVSRSDTGLEVHARLTLGDLRIADSIAVNGVCLTVVARSETSFRVDTVPETLSRTNLGRLHPGDPVNLERSMPANGRFGGHIVQGHVDCTGVLVDRQTVGNSVVITIQAPPEYMRYIVPKGFVAIDGASLTVVDTRADTFTVALIPYTNDMIAMSRHDLGYQANLEVDILGKYLDRLIEDRVGAVVEAMRTRVAGQEQVMGVSDGARNDS